MVDFKLQNFEKANITRALGLHLVVPLHKKIHSITFTNKTALALNARAVLLYILSFINYRIYKCYLSRYCGPLQKLALLHHHLNHIPSHGSVVFYDFSMPIVQ